MAVLRNKHIIESRKEGNQIYYRLRDPLLGEVMEKMRQYFLVHITKTVESLSEGEREVQAVAQITP